MKKIILITAGVLLSAGAAFSQTTPEEGTDVKSKPRRHSVGARKALTTWFLLNDNDSAYASYRAGDFHLQYAYRIGKRWHLGLEYMQLNENFTVDTFYSPSGGVLAYNPEGNYYYMTYPDQEPYQVVGTRYYRMARFLAAVDILQKPYLIIRFNAYIPIYSHKSYDAGTRVNGENDSSKSYPISTQILRLVKEDRLSFSLFDEPEFVLDLIYPLKGHEVGLSPYLSFVNNNSPRWGLYAMFNFRF